MEKYILEWYYGDLRWVRNMITNAVPFAILYLPALGADALMEATDMDRFINMGRCVMLHECD